MLFMNITVPLILEDNLHIKNKLQIPVGFSMLTHFRLRMVISMVANF